MKRLKARFRGQIFLAWFMIVSGSLMAQEDDEVAKLRRSYEQAIDLAAEPLRELSSRYRDELAKLKDEVQQAGDLETALKIQEEIKNYAKSEERNFSKIPDLQRLRKIYDDGSLRLQGEIRKRQLEIMRQSVQKFDELKDSLTKQGKLEAAVRSEDYRKKIVAQGQRLAESGAAVPPDSDTLGLLWELRTKADFEIIQECEAGRKGNIWILSSPHKAGSYIESDKEFRPPFSARFRAGTDSVEIRMFYASRQLVIFNWSSNPQQLRIHNPTGGRPLGVQGMGYIEKDKLHDLEIQVTAKKIRVLANGQVRGEMLGDFKDLEGPFGIGPAFGSKISVERFEVRALKENEKN